MKIYKEPIRHALLSMKRLSSFLEEDDSHGFQQNHVDHFFTQILKLSVAKALILTQEMKIEKLFKHLRHQPADK